MNLTKKQTEDVLSKFLEIPVQNSVSVTKKVSNNLTSLKQQQH